MASRLVRLGRWGMLSVAAVAWMAPAPAGAHAGGHDLAPGAVVQVWTDPQSRTQVPGTLLFVRDGHAHVEDVAGRIHTWPLTALTADDRGRAEAFRRRVEWINGVRPPLPMPMSVPEPQPIVGWLGPLALLALFVLWRSGASGETLTRLAVLSAMCALPLACGGQSTVSPSATATPSPTPAPVPTPTPTPVTPPAAGASTLASYFTSFPTHVRTRQDSQYLYVESDGLADHTLMVGIRSWQQQVPLPANYTGTNAWRLPLAPRLAAQPVSARTGLFRGAIALAVNGVPIFNALNNRGDDAFLFGELDDFGGHSGRADDYHYHTAPLFLASTVGATRPIGVALDGFILYGGVEPDGSAMRPLDDYNGHADPTETYHYHGTRTYPYINGGMKGVVTVSDQVEPQPSLQAIRPAGTPLNGAVITRHQATGPSAWTLEYRLNNGTYRVDYRIDGTRYTFAFVDPSGATRTETYGR